MKKNTFIFIFLFFGAVRLAYAQEAQRLASFGNLEPFDKADRVLILAPHPDDETIGCAGIIQQALNSGAKVKVAYLTNGDANELAFIVYEKRLTFKKGEFVHMGEVRRKEAIEAMKSLGLNETDLIFMGYPDFGTMTIFSDYWQPENPFRSILTRVTNVPYKECLSPGAPYAGESILSDLEAILKQYKPTKIFVSHPLDTNVDHRSFSLFLEIALSELERELPRPKIYNYLIHCVGWPVPRHYHPGLPLFPPQGFFDPSMQWFLYDLDQQQIENKHQAILKYRSQTQSSAFYLLAFARQNELFGNYPEVEVSWAPETLRSNFLSWLKRWFPSFEPPKPPAEAPAEALKKEISYSLRDDSLIISTKKEDSRLKHISLAFYLFGYSSKTPFAEMPKVRIITRGDKIKVFSGRKIIKAQGAVLESDNDDLILKIPLKVLGDPDFVLVSLKFYTGVASARTTAFYKIKIRR